MSQLHCYVPDELAKQFSKKADQAQMSVSTYLAMLVKRDVDHQWPEDYFELFGSCSGQLLERPEQAEVETRQALK